VLESVGIITFLTWYYYNVCKKYSYFKKKVNYIIHFIAEILKL